MNRKYIHTFCNTPLYCLVVLIASQCLLLFKTLYIAQVIVLIMTICYSIFQVCASANYIQYPDDPAIDRIYYIESSLSVDPFEYQATNEVYPEQKVSEFYHSINAQV